MRSFTRVLKTLVCALPVLAGCNQVGNFRSVQNFAEWNEGFQLSAAKRVEPDIAITIDNSRSMETFFPRLETSSTVLRKLLLSQIQKSTINIHQTNLSDLHKTYGEDAKLNFNSEAPGKLGLWTPMFSTQGAGLTTFLQGLEAKNFGVEAMIPAMALQVEQAMKGRSMDRPYHFFFLGITDSATDVENDGVQFVLRAGVEAGEMEWKYKVTENRSYQVMSKMYCADPMLAHGDAGKDWRTHQCTFTYEVDGEDVDKTVWASPTTAGSYYMCDKAKVYYTIEVDGVETLESTYDMSQMGKGKLQSIDFSDMEKFFVHDNHRWHPNARDCRSSLGKCNVDPLWHHLYSVDSSGHVEENECEAPYVSGEYYQEQPIGAVLETKPENLPKGLRVVEKVDSHTGTFVSPNGAYMEVEDVLPLILTQEGLGLEDAHKIEITAAPKNPEADDTGKSQETIYASAEGFKKFMEEEYPNVTYTVSGLLGDGNPCSSGSAPTEKSAVLESLIKDTKGHQGSVCGDAAVYQEMMDDVRDKAIYIGELLSFKLETKVLPGASTELLDDLGNRYYQGDDYQLIGRQFIQFDREMMPPEASSFEVIVGDAVELMSGRAN